MINRPSLYAAIDLGSNSFHMLVVREIAGTIQTVTRIKRKVRLAAGLNQNTHQLTEEAMASGWQCLSLFSEQLTGIPKQQIRVVATATIRSATNAETFLKKAQHILGCPISVISGEEEALLVYQGMSYTTAGSDKRLVIDIGGGSTELAIGIGPHTTALYSLPMGCVTWLDRYFTGGHLNKHNFKLAEQAACKLLHPVASQLRAQGWEVCVGASGTLQALQEIMMAKELDEFITLKKLRQLKQYTIESGRVASLNIEGLNHERASVFPGGLSILIAIFRQLKINHIMLAGGALREGLVYGMLHLSIDDDVRSRTLHSILHCFNIDTIQADRVRQLALNLLEQVRQSWQLDESCRHYLESAAFIHEIGLSVNFRQASKHAAYLIHHLDLPGFTPAQKKLLAALLENQSGNIDPSLLTKQNALPPHLAKYLCRLLRLAIIFATTRHDNALSAVQLSTNGDELHVNLPARWLEAHPLRAELLEQERLWYSSVLWSLTIS